MPIDQELLKAALLKWLVNEPLTIQDYRRVLTHLNTVPLRVDIPNVDQVEALKAETRQILRARYIDVPTE